MAGIDEVPLTGQELDRERDEWHRRHKEIDGYDVDVARDIRLIGRLLATVAVLQAENDTRLPAAFRCDAERIDESGGVRETGSKEGRW